MSSSGCRQHFATTSFPAWVVPTLALCLSFAAGWAPAFGATTDDRTRNDSAAKDQDAIRVAPVQVKPATCQVGELFAPFVATAVDGRKFDLTEARRNKATVIALTSTSCPICKKYLPTLSKIERQFSKRGVKFCFLNTLASDELEDIQTAIKDHSLTGPYIHDQTERLNTALGIRTTAEVFVFDSARTLVYRGAVDDQYGLGYSLPAPRKQYLVSALEELVAGEEISIPATTAPGCDIWQPNSKSLQTDSDVTYHNQVARIVQKNCVECHREEGLAPFSLETADDVIAHAGMIKTVIKSKTMPPWFAKEPTGNKKSPESQQTAVAAKTHKLKWANDRSLTAKESSDLLRWIDSKRPLGDPADAPVPRKFTTEWNIGQPDDIFRISQAIKIKATGTMPYEHRMVRTDFKEDKWISAVEIRPSERTVVHHVLVYVRKARQRGGIDETTGFLAAYVPGNSYQIFPPGFAKKIPAGSSLFFQLHYTPVGKATTDQTEIGFKYYEGTPKHVIRNKGIANRRIRIKPYASSHRETADLPINADAKILAFMPHMHLRGKAFRYDFVDPDQSKSTILDIPRYDFNWQLEYRLAEPVLLRKGSRIDITAWYDNSEDNPANPDASRTVPWGDQTDDEMMLGYVEYYIPSEVISGNSAAEQSKSDASLRKTLGQRLQLTKAKARLAFRQFDKDKDGMVTRTELSRRRLFDLLDADGDDVLTLEEVLAAAR